MVKFCVYRWGFALGWGSWANSVSWYRGMPQFHIGHLQLSSFWDWRLRRPSVRRLYGGRFYHRYLPASPRRWSDMGGGFSIWPVRFSFHWHVTCRGCVKQYSEDYERFWARRALA